MKRLRSLSLFLGLGVAALCAAPVTRAEALADVSMSTLQDLPTLAISVRGLSPDAEAFGLSEKQLIDLVRSPLEIAGVRVIAPDANEKTVGRPALEVAVNVNKVGPKACLFVLQLQLREDAKLLRKTKNLVAIPVVTWEAQKTGYTGKPEIVTAELTKLAEKFAEEWRAPNRRP